MLAIYLKYLTIVILERDGPVRRCVDNGVWPFPLAPKFAFIEELNLGIK